MKLNGQNLNLTGNFQENWWIFMAAGVFLAVLFAVMGTVLLVKRKKRRKGNLGERSEEQADGAFYGKLFILSGSMAGSVIPMSHMESVVVGRDAFLCNLAAEGELVSRRHCMVTYNAVSRTYLLMDLSENGTYLESGMRLPKYYAMELPAGMAFYLGVPENRFMLGEKRVW